MADLLGRPGNRRARLRALLDAGTPVLAPGAYDALSARLVEQAGFDVVYMTGFGTTAGVLGRPDVGLLGGAEMAAHAGRLADAVDLPVIADADTGYGNPLNVIRTVRDYERAGVAALLLEDQVMPKRCGPRAAAPRRCRATGSPSSDSPWSCSRWAPCSRRRPGCGSCSSGCVRRAHRRR
ncbi:MULTISPECIES: oxaloacetate decarboxylase [unclassified Pseudonocardia]|uniref:isocitrate lyase/PEP mutase family protein n=1 Tax=unclassified Pseudonocardia TaxID=2619320 RepID=UPI001CF6F1DA|nr:MULTISPECIES: isocitrate lyase/PEP mutase family protein [unclassified Pseudonocardia]